MLKKRLVSILFLLMFLFSNIGWSISVHYCQGEAHYSPLRYTHSHEETGCTMKMDQEDQQDKKPCCITKTPVEQPIKKFADKKCCQDELIKSNPSDHHVLPIYTPHFDFILPDYSWTEFSVLLPPLSIRKQETLAYYVEANAPPLYQLYCRLVFYA